MLAYIKDLLSIQECESSLCQSTCNSFFILLFVLSGAMQAKILEHQKSKDMDKSNTHKARIEGSKRV